jgi:peptidoglycan/LPS O-acetylase OafA/YrhL
VTTTQETVAPTLAQTHQTTLRYLPGIDGLRAISVLAVLVFHHYWIGGTSEGWLPGGFLGVEVFFVVSGYLITSLLLAERRETGRISLPNFWLRRARRLLPALWVMLAVVVAYSLLFVPDAIGTLRSDTLAALTYTSNWWQIVAHRSYFTTSGREPLLTHLWSLAIEEQFYLIWPPLLVIGLRKLGRQKMLGTVIAVAFISIVSCAITANYSVNAAYYATYNRFSGLLFGSALAFVFAPYRIRRVPGRGARIALDAAGAAAIVVLLASFGLFGHWHIHGFTYPAVRDSLAVFRWGFFVVDMASLVAIAAAVHPSSDVGRVLGWRPLRWVGLRSYGIYLWHYPIFAMTRPREDLHYFGFSPFRYDISGWPDFVIRVGLTFGAAALSYRFVEQPIRHGALNRFYNHLRAAHGEHRARLARRGVLIAGTLTLVAVMLGAGLANAKTQPVAIPGINEAAHLHDNGAAADPNAINALRGVTTTTPPHRKNKERGSTKPALPPHVLAIGDSVMLGAHNALVNAIPGIGVDAMVSRQFWQATLVLAYYAQHKLEPPVIVVHSGTNGRVTDAMFDQMMQTIGPGHQVYFLTARVPRIWQGEVNDTLHNGVKRWKNAHLLDWWAFAGCHDDWFVRDGFHLTGAGQIGYAEFVRDGLLGQAPTKCTK